MKIKKLNLIFFVFSVLAISCTEKYEKETKIFTNYLRNTHNLEISEETHTYFISPSIKCAGCEAYFRELISAYRKNATLITSNPIDYEVPENITVLLDSAKVIDKLNFGILNNYLIVTQRKKIVCIENLTPDKIDEIKKIKNFNFVNQHKRSNILLLRVFSKKNAKKILCVF